MSGWRPLIKGYFAVTRADHRRRGLPHHQGQREKAADHYSARGQAVCPYPRHHQRRLCRSIGPCEVATEAGISLRYTQKLFTERNSTCSDFIYSVRLDHAARLLSRRASLGTSQPLSEIAYACGFRDYTHFARKFRRRFGYPPGKTGAHSVGPETVRAGTGESAP